MIFGVTNILILIKTIKTMENKLKVWIAIDKSGELKFEIVKAIGAAIYSRPTVKSLLLNVNKIISAADAIINELKKQSK